jgi:DNA-binding MarR family transcriptional regulator
MVVKSTTSAAHFANLRSRTRLLTLFWRVAAQGISANGMKTLRNRSKVPALKSRNYHDRIPYLLGAISNILSAGGSRLYRRAFGSGLAEGRLIWVLGYESPLTAQRASQIMGVDKGATSRALAGLERRGLVQVTVDRADGRQRVIEFTASGRTLLERIMVVSQERERRLRSAFTEEELDTLGGLLRRLLAHAPQVSDFDPTRFSNNRAAPAIRGRRSATGTPRLKQPKR